MTKREFAAAITRILNSKDGVRLALAALFYYLCERDKDDTEAVITAIIDQLPKGDR